MNDTLIRLDRSEDKLNAIQNQIVLLQRQIEELNKKNEFKEFKSLVPIPPPPPPPPVPQPTARTSIHKSYRVTKEPDFSEEIEIKRSKPSLEELVKRKCQLRSTTVRRSPGGTPLTHWRLSNVQIDFSSPEDDSIGSVMKKALKRKFKFIRQVSPPSPIEGSPNENEFSF